MAKVEIILPAMGEGIIEATIIKLMVKKGDKVSEDDTLVEIATDKVDSEILAPEDGIISEIFFKENDIVKVGNTIINLENNNTVKNKSKSKETIKIVEELLQDNNELDINIKNVDADDIPHKTLKGIFISPLVRSIIKQENINIDELNLIKGTGINNRITKQDILSYIEYSKTKININKKTEDQLEKTEIIKMDRVRQIISKHMINSIKTSAHVMSAIETDVSNIVNWRNKNKENFLKINNERITFTPIFIQAVAKAISDFPMINISIDGENIIKKKNINIGMATALPNANLIVPVIKNADKQNLFNLSKLVNNLAENARNNNLKPEDIQGGTFTITNFGSFGNIFGTPIINQPEVAILGIGAIKKQVSVIETNLGDTIGIRSKMIMSLSYDHRVVDGALGGMFLKRISDYLEQFNEPDLV